MILAFILKFCMRSDKNYVCLIEAILGYLDFPHKQRLKAVQVNFICYFAGGSNSSSGISLFHKGESVKFGQVRQVPKLLGVITSSIKR